MNLAGFIDTFRDSIAQRVVESYPPLYRPSEQAVQLPKLLRSPLGAQSDAIRGAALSLQAHQGTTVVGEMGTGKTFIANERRARGGLQESIGTLPAAPRAQVEARGGGDGARREGRHRQLHDRPRTPPPLPRIRPRSLHGHVPRAGEALLPLAARHQ